MNWLAKLLGVQRRPPMSPDLAAAKAAHGQKIQRADFVLAQAFRKADAILRPYSGPERRRNPR